MHDDLLLLRREKAAVLHRSLERAAERITAVRSSYPVCTVNDHGRYVDGSRRLRKSGDFGSTHSTMRTWLLGSSLSKTICVFEHNERHFYQEVSYLHKNSCRNLEACQRYDSGTLGISIGKSTMEHPKHLGQIDSVTELKLDDITDDDYPYGIDILMEAAHQLDQFYTAQDIRARIDNAQLFPVHKATALV